MSFPTFRVYAGDCLATLRTLPAESVHCVVTSPPYWGLRDYRAKGQIGLEPTPLEYVDRLVAVFAEARRVLRGDGTIWLNLGDAYAQSGRGKVGERSTLNGARWCADEATRAMHARGESYRKPPPGFKPKDLIGLPWRVAFALQEDGWYLRSDIIWEKPNAMPEPVLDRPTKAHEYLFLLAKSERYFYDAEAVKERTRSAQSWNSERVLLTRGERSRVGKGRVSGIPWRDEGSGRNRRSVWSICVAASEEEHFATFPEDLVLPCVRAGTSERGCCSKCGAPLVRQVERHRTVDGVPAKLPPFRNTSKAAPQGLTGIGHGRIGSTTRTLGWAPSCACEAVPAPATVLDPFSGSGTTGLVALKQGRSYIGCELNPEYVAMSERRLAAAAPLFAREAAR